MVKYQIKSIWIPGGISPKSFEFSLFKNIFVSHILNTLSDCITVIDIGHNRMSTSEPVPEQVPRSLHCQSKSIQNALKLKYSQMFRVSGFYYWYLKQFHAMKTLTQLCDTARFCKGVSVIIKDCGLEHCLSFLQRRPYIFIRGVSVCIQVNELWTKLFPTWACVLIFIWLHIFPGRKTSF